MSLACLGLGSNVGDGAATIREAFARLREVVFEEARLSRLYLTRPLYVEDQPDFVNSAAVGETSLEPRELLAAVNRVEAEFGRDRGRERPKGPRSLDIDILLYGSLVLDDPDLSIPHPGLAERRFALAPLLELEGGLRDPRSGASYADILASLPEQGIYLLG
jgi:2-amino-4-hydroxy-6-hydroxymethyldihydropteridine diphosphokinase